MHDIMYDMYRNMRERIERVEQCEKDHPIGEDEKVLLDEWQTTIDTLEIAHPNIKGRYERNKAIQKSFTYEQIDFICYQIGEWYLEWKDTITTGDGHGHRLGYAKEKLKSRICGE